jgi:SAM-dependent methyltransferase
MQAVKIEEKEKYILTRRLFFSNRSNMDYRDIEAGATEDFFWFKAKLELIDILLKKANIKSRMKILSVGCGVGKELEVMQRYGDIYAIDADSRTMALLPDGLCIEKKVADVCNAIPYLDNSFDMVVAFDVLEHLKNDNIAIGEIHRVLKPDGFFIFTVPAFQFLFSSHDRALQHYRRYSRKMLKDLLHQFRCTDTGFWVFSLFLPVAIERLLKRNQTIQQIHYRHLPPFLNNLFYRLLTVENWFIGQRISMPIGTTIYGIYMAEKFPL